MTPDELQTILDQQAALAYCVEQRKRLLDTEDATIGDLNTAERELVQAAGSLQAALDGVASEKHWKQLTDAWRDRLRADIGIATAVCAASPYDDLQDLMTASKAGECVPGAESSEKDLDDARDAELDVTDSEEDLRVDDLRVDDSFSFEEGDER